MRQNNKNNRSRGRGRKGPNNLSRSYESNGPDVKVRGTAQHVADKYMSLARDALSAGDSIAAENYFQHAEHYNRIIMSAQAQMASAREEDRRNQSAQQDNPEQPSSTVAADESADHGAGEQPAIVEVNEGADANLVTADKDAADQAEAQPRPRRKRSPSQPRTPRSRRSSSTESTKATDEPASTPQPEASDKIVDNPPAFLMSD